MSEDEKVEPIHPNTGGTNINNASWKALDESADKMADNPELRKKSRTLRELHEKRETRKKQVKAGEESRKYDPIEWYYRWTAWRKEHPTDTLHRFWRITLPLLGHTVALITVLLTIGALQEFTLPFVLTQGGPGNATHLYNLLIFSEAFSDLRFGTATAAALLQVVFILVISLLQLKLIRPTGSY